MFVVDYTRKNKLFSTDVKNDYLTINLFDCYTVNKKKRNMLEQIMEEELEETWNKKPDWIPPKVSIGQPYQSKLTI